MRRLTLLGLCLAGMLAAGAGSAQATPRWALKEVGVFGGWGNAEGFVESMPQETVRTLGELTITSNSPTGNLKPISECLSRSVSTVEDPASKTLPGTSQMESLEVICEKETGGLNAAAPFPCTRVGEPFEMRIGGAHWASQLEAGKEPPPGKKFFDIFPNVNLEVLCLVTKEHAVYTGALKGQITIGRLRWLGAPSGELEDAGTGHKFNLKGTEFLMPVNNQYIVLRAADL
jgi:hypothetical protein